MYIYHILYIYIYSISVCTENTSRVLILGIFTSKRITRGCWMFFLRWNTHLSSFGLSETRWLVGQLVSWTSFESRWHEHLVFLAQVSTCWMNFKVLRWVILRSTRWLQIFSYLSHSWVRFWSDCCGFDRFDRWMNNVGEAVWKLEILF